ncbi:MAG: matrixin family metalloprotease, partial [Pseudohongiellaceae bacterium]
MKHDRHLLVAMLSLLAGWATPLWAFEISGSKWSGAETVFHVNMEGSSLSGISWNMAFISAADEWSATTDFRFDIVEEFLDPCLEDGRNSVDFTEDRCGTAYGSGVLAVTTRRFAHSILGPARIKETDIVINAAEEFNVYDGSIRFGIPNPGLDFRRIALHELGHAIGLDHEFNEPAIMARNIGDIDSLQPDDIAGVNALYGGLGNCVIKSLKLGNMSEALSAGDCRVNELTVGGRDDSFIDIYRFELAGTTELKFSMSSESLDSVLLLANAELNILQFDDQSTDACDSTLNVTLGPGNYFLLANTFDEQVKEDCGVSGNYQLSARFTSTAPLALGPSSSLLGDVSSAGFDGGISADNGISYGNQFTADQSLDIVATVRVDPVHQGQPGFLVVAAAIDDEIFLFDAGGGLVLFDPAQPLPRFAEKTLAAQEPLEIADDLVPASLGISAIEVDFVVGYGLQAQPDEVYFHAAPFSLIV